MTAPIRVVFMGNDAWSVPTLDRLARTAVQVIRLTRMLDSIMIRKISSSFKQLIHIGGEFVSYNFFKGMILFHHDNDMIDRWLSYKRFSTCTIRLIFQHP